ncbi:hypothetical protein SBRCBS47491_002027 [Sporothrix bragantina]|uniref:Uncharacterized protein n=1 Tax=Sporothrix bragantina TaxID=671064 RepID=A0ABP0B3F7_9PEZI
MSVSPSPSSSPRRMLRPQQQQQQKHASPLAHRYKDDDDFNEYDSYTSYRSPTRAAQAVAVAATTTPTKKQDHGRGSDRGGFYQISLTDGPVADPQRASSGSSASPASSSSFHTYQPQTQAPPQTSLAKPTTTTTTTTAHTRAQSYSQGYSQAQAYDRNNDNYGYRPNYGLSSGAASSQTSHTRKLSTGALRPVQEYHNAFANGEDPYTASSAAAAGSSASPVLPPPPSAYSSPARSPSPSASPSHFATLSSASRAFLEHRRQQSIPNLLPSIQSIGRNLGRAISPDRSLRSFQSSRPPIPTYKDEGSTGRDYRRDSDDEDENEDSAGSSDDYSDSENDDEDRDAGSMALTGDSRAPRRGDSSNNSNKNLTQSPSVAAGFSNWLTGAVKATSPDRATFIAASRTTTPEPSNLASRGGMASGASPTARRSMSITSDASATPRSSIMAAAPGSATTSPSRFSQLATSMTATLSRFTQQQSPLSPQAFASFEHDEFYNLDVDAALFPAGHPSDRDVFSPAAFKNLEANAQGALRRMQSAYRQRAVAHRELAAEKSVRDEELEEAETRAQHLKMQLEGMARRAADQQQEMQLLMDELAAVKKARAQERAMLLAGVPTAATANATPSTAPTIVSEDLGVEEALQKQRRRQKSASWRRRSLKSNDSSYDGNYSDEEEEEGEESALDEDARSNGSSSVFSRSRSPTFAPGINVSLDNAAGSGGGEQQPQQVAYHPRVAALGSGSMRLPNRSVSTASTMSTATVVSQFQSQPLSTFQKLVKNVASAIKDEEPDRFTTSTCGNCRGEDVSFAWNTVSVLRDENKHLKQRVGQLEVAVEGALDMVNGVGL